ncbi:serine protease, partial [Clavibacter michiganensis subsp. michiganensis]|nr:serine protease [Clavibacter michiganensis subsp. michiganensis]
MPSHPARTARRSLAAVARWTPERRAAAIDADGAADGATDGAAGSAPADDALAASAA